MGMLARIGGLNRLMERYPATEVQEGVERVKQTVQIGWVRYRSCVTVIISARGLYLNVIPPLSRRAEMLIPWDEIKGVSKTKLYGRNASQLSLGSSGKDNLIVYDGLIEFMQPYLRADLLT